MVTKVHKPIEAKVNEKTVSESNLTQPSRQSQLKINSYFREAHQKIRSEVEGIEHRIKVTLPEFSSYKHTLFLAPSRDYWYFLAVRIEIPPCYAMIGEFAVTNNRTVETELEPRLISECNQTETEGALGLPRNELESLAWAPPRSLLNPSPDVIIHAKVQAIAWYCRLLALQELLQRLDLRMEKQSEVKAVKSKNKLRQPPSPRDGVHAKGEKDSKPFRIGNQVNSLVQPFRDGLTFLRKIKAERPAAKHIWESELRRKGFKQTEIDALLDSKNPESAACRSVAESLNMSLKTVQNYYSDFKHS